MTAITITGIEVGQVWESRDRRLAGRQVIIDEITPNYVKVHAAGGRSRINRSRISIVQLPKTYRLLGGA